MSYLHSDIHVVTFGNKFCDDIEQKCTKGYVHVRTCTCSLQLKPVGTPSVGGSVPRHVALALTAGQGGEGVGLLRHCSTHIRAS